MCTSPPLAGGQKPVREGYGGKNKRKEEKRIDAPIKKRDYGAHAKSKLLTHDCTSDADTPEEKR